jgi:hypothetical protein
LKIQSGSNKPLSWAHRSHAACATVERMLVTHWGNSIERNVNKKPGAEFRPGANRECQFRE